jgi:hypothetical protein
MNDISNTDHRVTAARPLDDTRLQGVTPSLLLCLILAAAVIT